MLPAYNVRFEHEDIKNVKCRMAREDREHICLAFIFGCVVGKSPKTPKLSPTADDAITRGGIGGLGSPVYVCTLKL